MAGTSKEHFWFFNSSGQLVTGATLTIRAVGGNVDLFTFTEATPTYLGLYYVIADTGLYDFYVNGVKQTSLSPWMHIDSAVLPQAVTPNAQLFGDGSDGQYTLDGSQATVTGLFTKDSSSHYTLLRDSWFTNLTINTGVTLASNGFRVFFNGTLTLNGTANINNNGGTGGNGGNAVTSTGGSGGTAGTAAASNYLSSSGLGGIGGTGANANQNGGAAGVGATVSNGIGVQGIVGVQGGGGGGTSGGGGGSFAPTFNALGTQYGGVRNVVNAILGRAFSSSAVTSFNYNGTNNGGGGGGGSLGGNAGGGGGGGAGANGGEIILVVNTIAGSGSVTANGGTGGNGGNGAGGTGGSYNGGGGSGGDGGNGGLVFVINRTSTSFSGSITAAGGSGGSGGAKGSGGAAGNEQNGSTGTSGIAGLVVQFAV